jgi:hypothetical protein
MAVLVTPDTLPWASVVRTGIVVAFPYVPAVPTPGRDSVTVPPKATAPPPDNPVPAVTVSPELARAALAIAAAGKLTAPEETVSPLLAVNSPAEVMVPVLVVEMLPVVEIIIPAARSDPEIALKVGSPAALPCRTVVVVPGKVPSSPAAELVTTPAVVRPESVIEVVPVTVVNLPVDAVVAPMAVELIPVAVVLKLDDVTVRALAPVLIDEADRPDRLRVPEVPVKLTAPVVRVSPLEAVNSPAEVMAPVPVVEILLAVVFPLPVTEARVSASVMAEVVTPVTLPWASVVSTGIKLPEPYVPAVPVFLRVSTPPLVMVASFDRGCDTQVKPLPMSRLPEVAVVTPSVAPLIFPTTVAPCGPVTSPASEPLKVAADPVMLIE